MKDEMFNLKPSKASVTTALESNKMLLSRLVVYLTKLTDEDLTDHSVEECLESFWVKEYKEEE